MLELENPIEVSSSLGTGMAVVILDYGLHLNTVWIVLMHDGTIKHFSSEQLTVVTNYTFGFNLPQA